ncbi:sulfate transport system substrate-binding protein [Friedmanniella endophytica]|uniref:Sulfate transport system substrate-binding protein n=1 Tax=Microlunatus kandeliicorticis TaxID=1759536 RepID=A0A7W3IP25_9ACTN|nr:sulfate ABC transporter substrate-binding protein [Microlunatus kandeliicorticis]MBA8792623.1 sulfate transport system substrate-binding protein [Microlunatus kandeliicorticis]
MRTLSRRTLLAGLGGLGAAAITAGCSSVGPSSSGSGAGAGGSGAGAKLALVAFSVPKPAYDDLQKQFADTPDGKGVSWTSSYGASGDQARAVISGLPADYVAFSLSSDMTKLVDKGLVAEDWDSGANKGIVSTSVVVMAVRKGNPKNIRTWADLTRSDVKIVTPNPGSSGSARWNVLAAWTQITANGGSEDDAKAYLTKFYANVVSLPSSGREATSAFTSGTGDVLISYENEAIAARQKGQDLEYLVPDTTLKIENPGAVTAKAPAAAKAFLGYVGSDTGQKIFAAHGFRPLNNSDVPSSVEGATDPANPFPAVQKLVTIDQLGGWKAVTSKFFDENTGIVTKIQDAAKIS